MDMIVLPESSMSRIVIVLKIQSSNSFLLQNVNHTVLYRLVVITDTKRTLV